MKKKNDFITKFLETTKKTKKNAISHPWNNPISERQRKDKIEREKELYDL